jgi:hypothetical protein
MSQLVTKGITNLAVTNAKIANATIDLTSKVTNQLPIANGGTGQSTANAAFAALSPMTTAGDIIYENATPAPARLPIGSNGQVLTVSSGLPVWSSVAASANQQLSNLSGTVAVNLSLNPGADNSINLGSSSFSWAAANIHVLNDSAGGSSVDVYNRVLKDSAGATQLQWSTSGVEINSANLNMNSHLINNLANGVVRSDAINLGQLQDMVNGLSWKTVVRSATTAALPANTYANGSSGVGATLTGNSNGALSAQDGVTLVLNDRLLVKNEAATANNGIYYVSQVGSGGTPYILTRATDSDTSAKLVFEAVQVGSEASTQAGYSYRESDPAPITIGTTSIDYVNWATGVAYNFRNGLSVSGANVDVAPGDNSLTSTAGSLIVKEDPAGAIITGASGIKVQLESSNPSLQISSNKLGVKFDPAGALASGAAGVAVQVDNSTIEISSDALRVKDAGITLAKLASNSVDENKIVSTALSSTGALSGGSGTKLAVKVDAATVKINGSDNLEGLKGNEEHPTLSSTDITNQYFDLAHAAYGASASVNSISLSAVGLLEQSKTVDYTVSLTGGSGGVTRITFAGDLATGGNAALVSGDILQIKYDYL